MIITDKYIFFYGAFPSNFTEVRPKFKWEYMGETREFFCTEQAFMWAKAKLFNDTDIAEAILKEESDPMTCKSLGRMVKNYDDKEWGKVRYEVMLSCNYAKYTQNEEMKNLILNPQYDNLTFVEASPSDRIWGIGLGMSTPVEKLNNEKNWRGTNLLGKVVTEVRNMIISENKTQSREATCDFPIPQNIIKTIKNSYEKSYR